MSSKIVQELGANIRRMRNEAGETQRQYAARANIGYSWLAALESGRQNVSLAKLELLADALGYTVEIKFTKKPL